MDKQLTINLDKCNGCRMCEMACSLEKEGECSTGYSRIRIIKINESLDVPIVCLQCEDPACEKICPVKAITRNKIGVLWINNDLCIGCKKCVKVCPSGAVFSNPRLKKIIKCDLCHGYPLCVKFCQPKAIEYVRKNRGVTTTKGIATKRMTKSAKTRRNCGQEVRSGWKS
jgi:carbon-monoxide dehydrogenase iron sulfur subunit